jgi:death-on-curing protein
MTWRWVNPASLLAMHHQQLVEHGGLPGIRDRNAFESALARPRNQAAYGEPDAAALGAAYAFGLARNHPFSDGNKRIAWIAANLFLRLNGYSIEFVPAEAVRIMEQLAGGAISEEDLASWFRQRITSPLTGHSNKTQGQPRG